MEQSYVSMQTHEAFAAQMKSENERLWDENDRQNHRINVLEQTIERINALTVSMEKMQASMDGMLKELSKQGERLDKIEKEPIETGKQIKQTIVTTLISVIVGAVVGYALLKLGLPV